MLHDNVAHFGHHVSTTKKLIKFRATLSGNNVAQFGQGLREIIDLESARIVYKSLNGDAPSYMSDMFTKVNVSTTQIMIMT